MGAIQDAAKKIEDVVGKVGDAASTMGGKLKDGVSALGDHLAEGIDAVKKDFTKDVPAEEELPPVKFCQHCGANLNDIEGTENKVCSSCQHLFTPCPCGCHAYCYTVGVKHS